MAGLSDLTPDDSSSGSGGKSTHIKFWNPRNASDDINDSNEHRHKQRYYDSAQSLRNMISQNINVPVGEFLHALNQAEKHDNYEPGQELANTLFTEGEE